MTRPLTIGDVMTAHLWVIGEDAPLRQARSLMVEHDIHHLPVVQHGRCVGVLADRDVKRALDPDLGLPPEDELFVRDVCVFDVYAVTPDEPLERVLRTLSSGTSDRPSSSSTAAWSASSRRATRAASSPTSCARPRRRRPAPQRRPVGQRNQGWTPARRAP